MKTTRIITILILALSLIICHAGVSEAVDVGTAFTYQGRLIDGNDVADGLYDFQFKLYDDPNAGTQKGNTVYLDEVNVIDGYFTVELDFASVPNTFNGYARWLDIGVRPGSSSGDFTTLSPRQKVTPTPYSLMAADVKAPLSVGGYSSDPIISGINAYNEGIGVCGHAFGSNGQGVRGTNVVSDKAGSLGGNDYGVKSEGDLFVDGNDAAFRGTIGPNNGAPFPRPAYDSGWVSVSGDDITLNHNIGGNVDNYVVIFENKCLFGESWAYIGYSSYYFDLTTTSVSCTPYYSAAYVRVRIWVYN